MPTPLRLVRVAKIASIMALLALLLVLGADGRLGSSAQALLELTLDRREQLGGLLGEITEVARACPGG